MKLFIILTNIILAGSVVHAMEPATEPDDISPLVRYDGTREWAEIPAVKAEIDQLFESATKLKDAINIIKVADDDRPLEVIDFKNDEERNRYSWSLRKKDERKEWYGKALYACDMFELLTRILKSEESSEITSLQTKLSNSNGEILEQWSLDISVLARSVGEPGGVQDDYHFVFSSVSHPQWMILNKYGKEKVLDGEEYLGLLINPLCQSVTNIRKILGFRSGSWEVTPLDVLRSS